jgi:hypothetical protein
MHPGWPSPAKATLASIPPNTSASRADADGIVPVTDELWVPRRHGRPTARVLGGRVGIVSAGREHGVARGRPRQEGSETPEESIRRYMSDKYYKDHVQAYKKRPIYWLFSSGRQGAFKALVYLHRYNENTLARLRSEYVVSLAAKFMSRLALLEREVAASTSAGARAKLQRQIEGLRKKQSEILAYDEKLRHYADLRIKINLDDGVKSNYAKFGDLLAESKLITGGPDE